MAKLKSIFDRFDALSSGRLTGVQVEQMLVYMNRPVDSVQVATWLQKLKENEDTIEFPEFVAQYSVSTLLLSAAILVPCNHDLTSLFLSFSFSNNSRLSRCSRARTQTCRWERKAHTKEAEVTAAVDPLVDAVGRRVASPTGTSTKTSTGRTEMISSKAKTTGKMGITAAPWRRASKTKKLPI